MAPTTRRGLCFEDLTIGAEYQTAGQTLTEAGIVEFAAQWDPQPFHTDVEAAQQSIFGSLVASGLHTFMVSFRLYHRHGLLEGTALAGLGLDEMRFLKPVRPGDTLRAVITVVALKPHRNADRGVVMLDLATRNQAGETVFTVKLAVLVARRAYFEE